VKPSDFVTASEEGVAQSFRHMVKMPGSMWCLPL
jgi:hypothetical protein